MPQFQLTDEWSLELGQGFASRIEEGSLVLSTPDRIIWADIFDDPRPQPEKLAFLQADDEWHGARTWQFEQEGLLKWGYLTRDEDEGEVGWELTTFSLADASYALISFYFDEESALDWALKRWRSLRFDPI